MRSLSYRKAAFCSYERLPGSCCTKSLISLRTRRHEIKGHNTYYIDCLPSHKRRIQYCVPIFPRIYPDCKKTIPNKQLADFAEKNLHFSCRFCNVILLLTENFQGVQAAVGATTSWPGKLIEKALPQAAKEVFSSRRLGKLPQ